MRIRICIVLGSWIRIRIRVKIQELKRLKIEPWRAVDAHNVGVEDKNGALEAVLQIRILTFIHPGSPIRSATLPRGSVEGGHRFALL